MTGGAEAVTAAWRGCYDVVLMDVRCPRSTAWKRPGGSASHFGGRGPWIIALTANAQPGAREACLAAGMDDFLTRPLATPDLVAGLARARPMGGQPVLDPAAFERLRELVGDDPAIVSGLITDYLTDASALLHTLTVPSSEPTSVHRAAHTLKGLGATFGATDLAQLCQRFDTGVAGRMAVNTAAGGLGEVNPLVRDIIAEHERVTIALRVLAQRAGLHSHG